MHGALLLPSLKKQRELIKGPIIIIGTVSFLADFVEMETISNSFGVQIIAKLSADLFLWEFFQSEC